ASLKHSIPDAKISWLIKSRWSALLEGNPSVDEVIPYERTVNGVRFALQRLRAGRFDIAVDFQGLIQSALLARASGARRIIGCHRWQARERFAAYFYTEQVRTVSGHRVDQSLEIAAAAGACVNQATFWLPSGQPEGSLPEGPFVLACPLAGWGSKQWPLDY